MRTIRRKNWFIKRIALGFAVAALAAPVAQARVDEGPAVQANGVNAADYGMPRATPSDYASALSEHIALIRSQPRSTGEPQVVPTVTPQVVANGFSWKDAGIGAGLALALVLLVVGATLAARHMGREQTA